MKCLAFVVLAALALSTITTNAQPPVLHPTMDPARAADLINRAERLRSECAKMAEEYSLFEYTDGKMQRAQCDKLDGWLAKMIGDLRVQQGWMIHR